MAQQLEETAGSSQIDVTEWLKANKLSQFNDAFLTKNIAIEEIVDFEESNIANFMVELNFDLLSRKRFIRAINKMRQQNMPIAASANTVKHRVVVSSEEQRGIEQLLTRFDECKKQQQLIQRALDDFNLDKACNSTISNINISFEAIFKSVNTQKLQLLQQIDTILKQKQIVLKEQLSALQTEYIPMIEGGKKEYDAYSKGMNKNLNILKMVKEILSFNGTSMMTQPNIRFDIAKSQKIGSLFMNKLSIDDCDKPYPPKIKIVKVESDMISIEYDIKKEYYVSINKPILKISIQCALIKHDDDLWSEKEEKIQLDDSDSSSESEKSDLSNDDSSDSDDNSSDDDEGTGTYSKAKKKKKRKKKAKKAKKKKKTKKDKMKEPQPRIQFIERSKIGDYDDLKWIVVEKEITKKNKKIDKKFKIRENIKSDKAYVVKVRLLNESGWCDEPKQLYLIKTQKCSINSKILKHKERVVLKKMIDKRMKKKNKFKKYKLLYRATKDGWTMLDFHKKCVNKGETLTIVRTDTNNVFGGYRSWPFENPTNGSTSNKADPKAFIYLIRSSSGHPPKIFDIMGNNSQYAVYDYGQYTNGVMIGFGGGHDIGIHCNANINSQSYANKHSYNVPTSHHLNGIRQFTVKEIEVFRIYHK